MKTGRVLVLIIAFSILTLTGGCGLIFDHFLGPTITVTIPGEYIAEIEEGEGDETLYRIIHNDLPPNLNWGVLVAETPFGVLFAQDEATFIESIYKTQYDTTDENGGSLNIRLGQLEADALGELYFIVFIAPEADISFNEHDIYHDWEENLICGWPLDFVFETELTQGEFTEFQDKWAGFEMDSFVLDGSITVNINFLLYLLEEEEEE